MTDLSFPPEAREAVARAIESKTMDWYWTAYVVTETIDAG